MKNWIGKTGTFGTYKINYRFIKSEQTGGKEVTGRRNQSKNKFRGGDMGEAWRI